VGLIVLYGCGGLGLEVLSQFRSRLDAVHGETLCIVDSGAARVSDAERLLGHPVQVFESLEQLPDDASPGSEPDSPRGLFVMAVGDAARRRELFAACVASGLVPLTLVHDSAIVDPASSIGSGCTIGPYAYVGPFSTVGENCVLNTYASVGHDAWLGASSVLSPHATMSGRARCGEAGFLGTGSVITASGSLGSFGKLSANSVLTRSTSPGSLAHGNPATHRIMFNVPDTATAQDKS